MEFASSYTTDLLNASRQRLSYYKTALLVTAKLVGTAAGVQLVYSRCDAITSTRG